MGHTAGEKAHGFHLLGVAKLRFELHPVSNIKYDGQKASGPLLFDELDIDLNGVDPPAFAAVEGLEEHFVLFTPKQGGDQLPEGRFAVFRLDVQRGHGAHFFGSVAEIVQRPGVNVGEPERFRVEGVYLVPACLQNAQNSGALRLHALLVGDVPADPDDGNDLSLVIENRLVGPGEPAPALPGHRTLFKVAGMGRLFEQIHGLCCPLPVVLVDEGHEIPVHQLLLRLSEQVTVGRTYEQEPPFSIHLHDEVGLVLDQDPVVRLASMELKANLFLLRTVPRKQPVQQRGRGQDIEPALEGLETG